MSMLGRAACDRMPAASGQAGPGRPSGHAAPAIRLAHRPPPADNLTCLTLSALLWDCARARFIELRIGPEAFASGEAAMIAGVLLEGREFTPRQCRILWRDDGRTLPWYLAVGGWVLDPAWAVRIVERFAAERVRWWLPRWLVWIAEAVAAGRSVEWAARELQELQREIGPLLQGGAA